ncbi:hypothetical protein J2X67_005464 [Variovorax sp. 3319]|nr:hypothetical protein [Variovorax sp. 3319]
MASRISPDPVRHVGDLVLFQMADVTVDVVQDFRG